MSKRACIFVLSLATVYSCIVTLGPPTVSEKKPLFLDKVWMHIDGPWEAPPPEVGLQTRTASVTLLRALSNGEFSLMRCLLIEQPDKTFVISRGDGQMVFLGRWKERGTEIEVRFRLLYANVLPVDGPRPPGPEVNGLLSFFGNALEFDGKKFDLAEKLEMVDYEEFISPLRNGADK